MRKFIFALLLLLGVLFILLKISEVQDIVNTLQHGDWRFLLLAFFGLVLWVLNATACYWAIFKAIGLEEKFSNLLPVVTAANYMNIVIPTAGMSGMAIFVTEAHRRNYSPGRAAVAGALEVLLDYAAFACELGLGFIVLIRRNNLNVEDVIAAIVLVIVGIGLAGLAYLGMRSSNELGRVLAWMARFVNRLVRPFLHREYLAEERAHEFARDASEGLSEIHRDYSRLLAPFLLTLSKFALLTLIFYLCFVAFSVPVSLGTLVASFAIGYLFMIVSPTPSGLGFVEAALPLVLHSMFIPTGTATVITLAYRGITFWLPLLIGMLAFRFLGGAKEIKVVV